MSVRVAVDRQKKLVVTSFYGVVTDEDARRQLELLRAEGPFDKGYSAITDYTGAQQFDISSEIFREIAGMESPLTSGARRVVVAPSDVIYGTTRMFQSLATETRPNLTIVRTLREAYEHLGIESMSD